MHKRLPLVALALACGASPTLARDYFSFDRRAAEDGLRPVVAAQFPGVDLKAQCGAPGVLRHCRYDLSKQFAVRIVETAGGKIGIPAFMGGADGPVYEISVELSTTAATPADWDKFADLCAAAVSVARSGLPEAKSKGLVSGLITKAIAKHADPAQARQSDRASTVIVDYSHDSSSRCRVTAEDDYLPASGIYKAGEDVP